MQADRLGIDCRPRAVAAAHPPFLHHHQRARHRLVVILNQRARLAARHQRAIGQIPAIGEDFFARGEPITRARADKLAARQPHQNQRRIEILHRLRDGVGKRGVFRGRVIEHAVRLHVRQPAAFGAGDSGERADLIERLGVNRFWRQLHRRAPEIFTIREARMRAHRHAVRQRQPHALAHGLRIARMEAAGDVGGANQRHQLRVVAAAFAEIGVEINLHH